MKNEKNHAYHGDMRPGRKSKINNTLLGKLREAFLWGCTDREACLYADINPDTLYAYQKENPGYSEQKEQYKSNPVLIARKVIVEAMKNDPNLALKFLERRKSDEFSLKHIVVQPPDSERFGGFIVVKTVEAAKT